MPKFVSSVGSGIRRTAFTKGSPYAKVVGTLGSRSLVEWCYQGLQRGISRCEGGAIYVAAAAVCCCVYRHPVSEMIIGNLPCRRCEEKDKRFKRAEKRIQQLYAALRLVEWSGRFEPDGKGGRVHVRRCESCGQTEQHGHAAYCRVGTVTDKGRSLR